MGFAQVIHILSTAFALAAAIICVDRVNLLRRILRNAKNLLSTVEDLDVRLANLERGQDKHQVQIASLNGKYGVLLAKLAVERAESTPEPTAEQLSSREVEREELYKRLARSNGGG